MGRPAGQAAPKAPAIPRPVTGVSPVSRVSKPSPLAAMRTPMPTPMGAPPAPLSSAVKLAKPALAKPTLAKPITTPKPTKPVALPQRPTPAPVDPVKISPVKPSPVTLAPAPECHTVREILPPWHVLQEKLNTKNEAAILAAVPTPPASSASSSGPQPALTAERGALEALAIQEAVNTFWRPNANGGNDASDPYDASDPRDGSDPAAPSSGVRLSDPGQGVVESTEQPALPPAVADSLLTFKVYTLAELERRSDAPISMRASRLSFDTTASSRRVPWQRVGAALRAFATEALAWWRNKELDRSGIKVALRRPFDQLGDELQVAVEAVDWKKLGVHTGIVVGATLTLLFAVLTAAELTDSKPAHLASTEAGGTPAVRTVLDGRGVPATNMAAMGVQPVALPNALVAPIVIAPPPADDPAAAADEATPAPAKKPAKKPKPKAKLTFRNPDAVFHP
jgi:hypothetical protein